MLCVGTCTNHPIYRREDISKDRNSTVIDNVAISFLSLSQSFIEVTFFQHEFLSRGPKGHVIKPACSLHRHIQSRYAYWYCGYIL